MNDDSEAEKGTGRDSKTKTDKGEGSLTGRRDRFPFVETGAEGLSTNREAGLIAGESLESVGESIGAPTAQSATPRPEREATGKSAFLVGSGILISRIIGVVRQRVFAYYL